MLGSRVRAPADSRKQPPFLRWLFCFCAYLLVRCTMWMFEGCSLFVHAQHPPPSNLLARIFVQHRPTYQLPAPSHLITGCEDVYIYCSLRCANMVSLLRLRRSSPGGFTQTTTFFEVVVLFYTIYDLCYLMRSRERTSASSLAMPRIANTTGIIVTTGINEAKPNVKFRLVNISDNTSHKR